MHIRLANPDDARAVHLILQEVWQESLLVDVFAQCVSSSSHFVLVAIEDDQTVGFLSAFLIAEPTPRCEIDLLAVRPRSQGKGIGANLIEEALCFGSHLGANLARASIRVENRASQNAFARVGFLTDSIAGSLLLWEPMASDAPMSVPEAVRLIPVDTLTYRGLWIEGWLESELGMQEQRDVVRYACNLIAREGRLNTGALVPVDHHRKLAPDLIAIATDHGRYHRWEHSLT